MNVTYYGLWELRGASARVPGLQGAQCPHDKARIRIFPSRDLGIIDPGENIFWGPQCTGKSYRYEGIKGKGTFIQHLSAMLHAYVIYLIQPPPEEVDIISLILQMEKERPGEVKQLV